MTIDDFGVVTLEHTRTGERDVIPARLVVGADGAFSTVRACMMRLCRVNFSQTFIEHGYKELHIPAGPNGTWRLSPVRAFHVWPKHEYMLQCMPNTDGTFTGTMFAPYSMFERLEAEGDGAILAFFHDNFPDLVPIVPDLIAQFRTNPTSALVTVRVTPWNYADKVMLIGDAAHAMTPFFGQVS